MAFKKEFTEFRYLFDIDSGILHDLQSSHNPKNKNCGIEKVEHWVVFDTERTPIQGALIKKLTTTREVVDIEVRRLCQYCMKPEDEDLVTLLQDYFLTQSK